MLQLNIASVDIIIVLALLIVTFGFKLVAQAQEVEFLMPKVIIPDIITSGVTCRGQVGQCASKLCCNNRLTPGESQHCCSYTRGVCCNNGLCCPENYCCDTKGTACVSMEIPANGKEDKMQAS